MALDLCFRVPGLRSQGAADVDQRYSKRSDQIVKSKRRRCCRDEDLVLGMRYCRYSKDKSLWKFQLASIVLRVFPVTGRAYMVLLRRLGKGG